MIDLITDVATFIGMLFLLFIGWGFMTGVFAALTQDR